MLDHTDAEGIALRAALTEAGHDPSQIVSLARNPSSVLGYLEVHIEQGPVLLEQGLPLGVVSAINGSCRYALSLEGTASHAGTTPMSLRRDAAACAAEIVLMVERRCSRSAGLVGTVGQLNVPRGSVNVIAGSCDLSLDIRAPDDHTRDHAVTDVLHEIDSICQRRDIDVTITKLMQAAAAPCAAGLTRHLSSALTEHGIPVFSLPSGAGHDAMMMARVTDIAMLFVRCGNGGISHNPLETMTADDAEIAAAVVQRFLLNLADQN